MEQEIEILDETPSQTAGPFVHIGLAPSAAGLGLGPDKLGQSIAGPQCQGERIRIEGRVLDGTGAPVTDVLIEVWQADATGCYNHPEDTHGPGSESGFSGFGRVVPDLKTGVFCFETVKPGSVPGPGNSSQAPHLNLWLVARGINLGLNTRMYFADEEAANATDTVLSHIESDVRRQTLVARGASGKDGCGIVYCFDIHLQGASETVFLDI